MNRGPETRHAASLRGDSAHPKFFAGKDCTRPDQAAFRRGTLSPSRRASLMPMATACFWLVTFFPLRPERSLPSPYSCITLLILFCAFLPYLRPDDFLLDERFFVAIPLLPIFSLEPLRPFSAPSTSRSRWPVCDS